MRPNQPHPSEPAESKNTLYHLKNTLRAIWKLYKGITNNGN